MEMSTSGLSTEPFVLQSTKVLGHGVSCFLVDDHITKHIRMCFGASHVNKAKSKDDFQPATLKGA